MIKYADICFGNARDAAKCLGYSENGIDFINGDYAICVDETHMSNVVKAYNLKYLVTTLRNSISASDNGWSAAVCDGNTLYCGKQYDLTWHHIRYEHGKISGIRNRGRCDQTYDSWRYQLYQRR